MAELLKLLFYLLYLFNLTSSVNESALTVTTLSFLTTITRTQVAKAPEHRKLRSLPETGVE